MRMENGRVLQESIEVFGNVSDRMNIGEKSNHAFDERRRQEYVAIAKGETMEVPLLETHEGEAIPQIFGINGDGHHRK